MTAEFTPNALLSETSAFFCFRGRLETRYQKTFKTFAQPECRTWEARNIKAEAKLMTRRYLRIFAITPGSRWISKTSTRGFTVNAAALSNPMREYIVENYRRL